jgi:hypothetical protein
MEIAVKLLEDHGFHVTDANEERAMKTGGDYVIDRLGTRETGALLMRVVPVTPTPV